MPRRLLSGEEPLEPRYYTRPDSGPDLAGVPLGGLGTGSLELHSDGSFREWQIFNNWGNNERIGIWEHWPSYDLPGALMAVRVSGEGVRPVARVLELNPLHGLPGVSGVDLEGQFPVATLRYADPSLPLALSLHAFGPFVPHDLETSCMPAVFFVFEIASSIEGDLDVDLVFSIENPHGSRVRNVDLAGTPGLSLEGTGPGGDSPSGMCLACRVGRAAWWTALGDDPEADTRELWRIIEDDAWSSPSSSARAERRAALRARVRVAAGRTVEAPFILSWYFPDHRANGTGENVGHWYAVRFASAVDVAAHASEDWPSIREHVFRWHDAVYGGTLPAAATTAAGNTLGLMVKSSWWTQDGRFTMYESFQCPMLDPVHVRAPGTYALATLFPELDRQVLRRFAAHQFPSGRIPEQMEMESDGAAIAPDGEEEARELADVAPLFVLMVARDALLVDDESFLRALWPSVRSALAYEERWDRDGDGLPDGVGPWTTYDGWDMGDTTLYVAGVWLAALVAGMHLAALVGDEEARRWCEARIAKAAASVDATLWNGEHYTVAASAGVRRDCTLVDGLAGLWHCRQLGLAFPLPAERLSTTIEATVRANGGDSPHGATACVRHGSGRDASGKVAGDDRFAESVWPATTWLLATLAVLQGKVEDGLALAGKIHRALTGLVRGGLWLLPDVIDADTGLPHHAAFTHYLRSGSAWPLLSALTGFSYDPREKRLRLVPPAKPVVVRGLFATAHAWGTVSSHLADHRVTQTIAVDAGSLSIREWLAPAPARGVSDRWRLTFEGGPSPLVEPRAGSSEVVLRFGEALRLGEGRTFRWTLEAVAPDAITPA